MAKRPVGVGALAETAGQASTASVPHPTDETEQARCRRCNRPLHTELAVAAGLGPVCAMTAIARVPLRPGVPPLDGQLVLPLAGGGADE